MNKSKHICLFLVVTLFASLVLALVVSTQYGLVYREVYFSSQESDNFVLKTRPFGQTMNVVAEPIDDDSISPSPTMSFSDAEPIRNTTWYANGSKFVSMILMDSLVLCEEGNAVREDQVAANTMEQSAQMYRWSFITLDAFEDVTKGERKLKDLLEWVSFKAGITYMITRFGHYVLCFD